ncbi:MAG: hypothetical protein VB021_02365 [Oscillospiraceae bacterium]|nr:hypothetical protein [Oscillospiraceae bacterium]
MDSRKKLEKFLKPATGTLIAGIVCLALCVIGIIGLIVSTAAYTAPEAVDFYPSETPVGDSAYIDAVMVSDWLYKVGGDVYYFLQDASGYSYIAVLSDSQFAAMSDQYAYFTAGSGAAVPAPYHLEGIVASVDEQTATDLASVIGLSGSSDYYARLGKSCLDCTSAPSSDTSAIFGLIALFSGLFGLMLLLIALPKRIAMKKCLGRLDSLGQLDTAADALDAPDNIVYGPQQIVLSRDYVFSPASGAVLRYEDIFWCFMRIQRTYFIKTGESLVGNSAVCGQVSLAVNPVGKKNAGMIEQILQQISARNPQILLGYTRDNINAFREYQKSVKTAAKN